MAEREVFELLLENYSLTQIIARLNKSEGTIKNQINSVFKKLNITKRSEIYNKFSHIKKK